MIVSCLGWAAKMQRIPRFAASSFGLWLLRRHNGVKAWICFEFFISVTIITNFIEFGKFVLFIFLLRGACGE
jgi:hypothetical protein